MRPEDQQIRVETANATPMRGFVASLTRLEHASDLQFIQPRRDASPEVLLRQALADPIVLQDVMALQQHMPGTAGERLGLALLASQMTGEQFGSVLHSEGSISVSSSREELCPDTESRTREALLPSIDGMLIGISREGRLMMAVKVFPGRAAAIFFQPVAFDKGVAVPGVWYEVDDQATRHEIQRQSDNGNPQIKFSPQTRLTVMRAVRDVNLDELTRSIGEYTERVLREGRLQQEIQDPYVDPRQRIELLNRFAARVTYHQKASDER